MSQLNMKNNEESSSKSFLFDFKDTIASLGKDCDYLYFYPNQVRGFIEACVLSTQRHNSVLAREYSLTLEIQAARKEWGHKEEDASWRTSFTFNKVMDLEAYECMAAIAVGAKLDEAVFSKLKLLREAVGDYAIDRKMMHWTDMNALLIKIHF